MLKSFERQAPDLISDPFFKVLFNEGMAQRNLMSHKETPQSHMRKGMF